jgi:CDP-diacylglycerol--serine O-phosphatidyltransferase
MLFLSFMMVSEVKYPSFKALDLRARRNYYITLFAILLLGSVVILQEKMLRFVLPPLFTAYLVYGFIRPRISRQIRREIEAEDLEEDEEDPHDDSDQGARRRS